LFDIIGDVHGQFDKLIALLTHLGYRDNGGIWRHPFRSAVFVGDLIDRGPRQLATVELVRRMVQAGSAHCVMEKKQKDENETKLQGGKQESKAKQTTIKRDKMQYV